MSIFMAASTDSVSEDAHSGRERSADAFKASANLVLVPVTVTDHDQRTVSSLEQSDFSIYDSSEKQEIRYFARDDGPVSLAIILDMSSSMSSKMAEAREAIRSFLELSNSEDEFSVIEVRNQPVLLLEFTTSKDAVQEKIGQSVPGGRTALLDSVYLGLEEMKHAHYQRRALLVISDGGDNNSRFTFRELRNAVREADVQIYGIGIYDDWFMYDSMEERCGPYLMNDIAETTGGRTFRSLGAKELIRASETIARELRSKYLLGFYANNVKSDGQWHKLKVRLNSGRDLHHLHVRARSGYYARPSQ